MKQRIALAALVCLVTPLLGAQVLDQPAATIRLVKTESITVSQLKKVVASLEAQAGKALTKDQRMGALDSLVSARLVVQAAERDKITASDAELKGAIANYEQTLGAGTLGRSMTDAELQQYLKNNGISYDDFVKQLKDQLTMVAYAKAKRKGAFDAIKPVTDAAAQDYSDSNKASFFVDDLMSVRHILIDTRQLTSKEDRDKAARRADDILKELKAGASFADLVMKYSEDTTTKYKNGDLGTLVRNNAQQKQLLGAGFFDAVFKLKKGETSGVIQSNVGYHIV